MRKQIGEVKFPKVNGNCCNDGFTARNNRVITYPFPAGIPASSQFRVTVNGQAQFVHAAEVADFASFAIIAPVEVTIACGRLITSAVVRPRSRNIIPKLEGQTLQFTVDAPGPLCVEVNGVSRPALFLFIDPPEDNAPARNIPGVVRFTGGRVHEAGEIRLKDNETLYLEPGAVVHGTVRADTAKNVRILGRGILDARPRTTQTNFIYLKDCTGVEICDVIVLGSYGWTIVPWHCRDVRLTNVKVFSWRDNDDGLDICGCHDVVVDRCFFRTKDDCIALKLPEHDGLDVRNVLVQRSVFWNAEWGNALEIGFELRGPTVRKVIWRDCDIIREEKCGAVFSIHNGDFATVEDVLFDNIRVEDAQDKLVDFRVGLSIYSSDCPERYHRLNPKRKPTGLGPWVPLNLLTEDECAVAEKSRGAIRNVRFKDIRLLEGAVPPSFIINQGGKVEGITFENVRVGERVLDRVEDLKMILEGVRDIRCLR